jgi:hypothetical protein
MSAQVEEVSTSARMLEEMAQTLQDVVSQFKLAVRTQPASHTLAQAAKPAAGIRQPAAHRSLAQPMKISKN